MRLNAGFQQAFVRIGSRARWQTLPVSYRIHAGGLPGLGNGSEFIAVQRAFDTWQNLPSSSIAFRYEGTTPVQNGGNDGVNVISFQDTSFSFGTGTIAVTFLRRRRAFSAMPIFCSILRTPVSPSPRMAGLTASIFRP